MNEETQKQALIKTNDFMIAYIDLLMTLTKCSQDIKLLPEYKNFIKTLDSLKYTVIKQYTHGANWVGAMLEGKKRCTIGAFFDLSRATKGLTTPEFDSELLKNHVAVNHVITELASIYDMIYNIEIKKETK